MVIAHLAAALTAVWLDALLGVCGNTLSRVEGPCVCNVRWVGDQEVVRLDAPIWVPFTTSARAFPGPACGLWLVIYMCSLYRVSLCSYVVSAGGGIACWAFWG